MSLRLRPPQPDPRRARVGQLDGVDRLPTTAEGQLTITPAPRELFTLAGVGGALPSGYGAFAAPAWLGALAQSPYVAPKTDEEDR